MSGITNNVQEILLHMQEACFWHMQQLLHKTMGKFQVIMHCKIMETHVVCFFLIFVGQCLLQYNKNSWSLNHNMKLTHKMLLYNIDTLYLNYGLQSPKSVQAIAKPGTNLHTDSLLSICLQPFQYRNVVMLRCKNRICLL